MSTAALPNPAKQRQIRYDRNGDVILPRGAEFVDGRIVFKRRRKGSSMSEKSNWTGNQLLLNMMKFVEANHLGVVFRGAEEQGYQCFPQKPSQIRKPDVSFVRRDMSNFFLRDRGWTPEVPELIAEVLSPGDKLLDLESRIADFLTAGTKLVWIINPIQRTAQIIHQDRNAHFVPESGTLDGENVLPGFKLPLASILPPKSATI